MFSVASSSEIPVRFIGFCPIPSKTSIVPANALTLSMNTQSMNRFLGACGATGPLRLAAERPRVFGPVSVTLDKPFALIGSGVHADLRLDDNQISHRHLYLQVYNGRVFAIDLGSRTGTHWENGLQPFGWLDLGKSLWIGRHRVYLEEDDSRKEPIPELPPEPLLSRDFKPPNLPPVSLEFVKGGIHQGGVLKPARCAVNRVLVLMGRTDGCKIRLMDSSVSKFHCSLIRTPRGVWVVDLLSRNGIWVNGTKVPWARLEQGDRLEVGEFVLRLRYDEPENEPVDPGGSPKHSVGRNEPTSASHDSAPERSPETQSNAADEAESLEESSANSNKERPNLDQSPPAIIDEESTENQHHALVVSPKRGLIPVELSESIAVIIANQFSQMQQQMFDQFHQAMRVMFQTFSTLHRDQMEMVRKEMDRVHDLTRQLHALQAELAKQPAAAKDPEVRRLLSETEPAAAAPSVDPARAFSPEGWNEAFREAAEKVMAAKAESESRREPRLEPVTPIFAFSSEPGLSLPAEKETESGPLESPAREENRQPINTKVSAAPEYNSGQQVPPAGADIHALLCQKIAAIQAERQSRWQKIIGFLAGKQTGEAVP
jgi:pSer/pThr/pTyr-binding forkhead associated (FHA) protein